MQPYTYHTKYPYSSRCITKLPNAIRFEHIKCLAEVKRGQSCRPSESRVSSHSTPPSHADSSRSPVYHTPASTQTPKFLGRLQYSLDDDESGERSTEQSLEIEVPHGEGARELCMNRAEGGIMGGWTASLVEARVKSEAKTLEISVRKFNSL